MNTPRTDEVETANKFPASKEYYEMVVHARALEAELATERARLDWLGSDAGVDWQWSDAAGGLVSRATVDAAMQEGAK
jgi:hypothetical protein